MSDNEVVECRMCGKWCQSLGGHLRRSHGIGADEYRNRFGLRPAESLDAPATRARRAQAMEAAVAAGVRSAGKAVVGSDQPTSREVVAAVVTDVERGLTIAAAVARSPIGYRTFYGRLEQLPDLRTRLDAALLARSPWRQAKLLGQPRYRTGRPCRHGHVAERLTSDKSCIACRAARSRSQ